MRVLLLSAALLAGIAATASAADQKEMCLLAALNNYNKINMGLLAKSEPLMTVETTVAQRRLQEQYCLRVAQCQLAPQQTTVALDTAFDACLRDEAMEKYELVPSEGN